MTLAFLAALLIGRPKDLYNILAGAALIILIASPKRFRDFVPTVFQRGPGHSLRVEKLANAIPLPQQRPAGLRRASTACTFFFWSPPRPRWEPCRSSPFNFNRVSAVALIAHLVAVPLLGILALIPA
jgi:hypothetical protein